MIVVSDTSPIANLIQIGQLHLLHEIFSEVIIPPAVYREVMALEKFNIDLSEFRMQNGCTFNSRSKPNKLLHFEKTWMKANPKPLFLQVLYELTGF